MNETFFYDPYSQETHPNYWDCECIEMYIHPKTNKYCNRCGADRDDQPDSRISEMYTMHYKNIKECHEQRRIHKNTQAWKKN